MSHAPREWPTIAKDARDRAAEEAVKGQRALRPIVEGKEFTQIEELRRQAIALDALQNIARLLESVGAQTRP